MCEKRLSKIPIVRKGHGKTFLGDGNILYCHCGGGYTFLKTYICTGQNRSIYFMQIILQ